MIKDPMGERFKAYEKVSDHYLTRRVPVILRVDGRAFHTVTRNMARPFDLTFMDAMVKTTFELCQEAQGCKFAYVQSDEISLLLTDWDKLDTEGWFGYRINKMNSIASCVAANTFYGYMGGNSVEFDSRAFSVPKEDVCNYFLWRQRDATRNSISMVAQANFSHKELQGLNSNQLQDKLFLERGINWNDLPGDQKRGTAIYKVEGKWYIDTEIPIFSQDRNFIERWLHEKREECDDPGSKNPFRY